MLFGGRIGAQSEDLVERWFDGFPFEGIAAVAALAVFVGVVRASAAFPPNAERPGAWPITLLGLAMSLLGIGVLVTDAAGHGSGLLVLGVITLVLGLGELVIGQGAPPSAVSVTERDGALLRGPVAAFPAIAVGLVLLRASANHLVANGRWQLLGVTGLLVLAGAAVGWWWSSLRSPADIPWVVAPTAWTWTTLPLAFSVATVALMVVAAEWAAGVVGSFAILILASAGVAAVGVVGRRAMPAGVTLSSFERLGFGRTPIITLALAWVVVASALNGTSNSNDSDLRITHYDAPLVERDTMTAALTADAAALNAGCRSALPDESSARVASRFCRWLALEATRNPQRSSVPLALVTASGGGIRAAAWTETVLDCLFLQDDPVTCAGGDAATDRFGSIYAASGASGGSVGIATTVAERLSTTGRVEAGWRRAHLDDDALSPMLGRTILHDTLLGLFGVFTGHDRTKTLEDGWSTRWRDDARADAVYCAALDPPRIEDLGLMTVQDRCAQHVPLLLFNGTDVGTGRRVDISPPYLVDERPDDDRASLPAHRYLAVNQDLSLFTAAFLSARFPLVTPSGRLPSCREPSGDRRDACPDPAALPTGGRVLNVVDGGYAENSGTAQVHAAWQDLEPIVAAWNAVGSPKVRVMLVEIENGELAISAAPSLATSSGELLRPIETILNVYAGRADNSRDALRDRFTDCSKQTVGTELSLRVHIAMYEHPGRVLPLGWALSDRSLDDIDRQLALEKNRAAAECFIAWADR